MKFRNKGMSNGKRWWQNYNLIEPSWFRYIKHKIKDNDNLNKDYFSFVVDDGDDDDFYTYNGTPDEFEIKRYHDLGVTLIYKKDKRQ